MMYATDLISPEYRGLQGALHARPEGYGGKGDKWAPAVLELARRFKAYSILDYGCGQGRLVSALRLTASPAIRLAEYDPAIEGKRQLPDFADLVVCTDVLEHVEPERLSKVLEHLSYLARRAVFVVVATRPSNKTLDDGRNAHLILEDAAWWESRVREAGFDVQAGPDSPLLKPSREWVAVLTEKVA